MWFSRSANCSPNWLANGKVVLYDEQNMQWLVVQATAEGNVHYHDQIEPDLLLANKLINGRSTCITGFNAVITVGLIVNHLFQWGMFFN